MSSAILVPIADGFEEIETTTIVDILRRAGREVVLAGLEDRVLIGSRRIQVKPDMSLDEALKKDYAMIILPGGQPGVNHLKADSRVLNLLRQMAQKKKWIGAICAAPLILKEAGLIEGLNLTSFPGLESELTGAHYQQDRVVVDGHFITSRSPGTALEFALKLVEILCGDQTARELAATVLSLTETLNPE